MSLSPPTSPPTRRRRRHRVAALALVSITGLGLAAGCSATGSTADVATLAAPNGADGTTPPSTAAASTDPEQAMRDFAKCMRDHGIDMPDPQPVEGGKTGGVIVSKGGGPGAGPGDKTKMEAADKECRHFMDGVAQDAKNKMDPAEVAKMKEQALAFSKCMREHGIDMPDPQFGDDGGFNVTIGGPDQETPAFDPQSPAFQDAQKACEEFMPKGPDGQTATPGAGPVVAANGGDRSSGGVSVNGGATDGGTP